MNKTTRRPYVNMMNAKAWSERALANKSEHFEGWSNSATFTFSLYFLQEAVNHEALCNLIRSGKKDASGKAFVDGVYDAAERLMENTYYGERMEPFDGDEKGSVNVREIVDTLATEIGAFKAKA